MLNLEIRKGFYTMTEREFYYLIEGRDEENTPNAMCSLSILLPNKYSEPEEAAAVATSHGAVYLAIVPGGLSMIDVMFEDETDCDYLQMGGVCEKAFSMISAANANGTEIPSITLSVSEHGDFSAFMTCVNCAWSYIPTSAEKVCTGIRFIVETKNIHFLELDSTQIDKILYELEEEIICDEELQ